MIECLPLSTELRASTEVLDMGVHDMGRRDKLNQLVNEEAKVLNATG